MDYAFFQEYWWLLVSVLGALLVFLLFVQGGQSLFFSIGKEQLDRKLLVNSIGRKWEFTFTTLVVFGGGFFASFPLFYSTSFGGAYWVWMLILFCFIIQAPMSIRIRMVMCSVAAPTRRSSSSMASSLRSSSVPLYRPSSRAQPSW